MNRKSETMIKAHCYLLAAALVVGCNRSEPAAKPVAPEKSVLPPGHPPLGITGQSLPPGAGAEAPNPQWNVPSEWQEGKPGPMRRAQFAAKAADGQSAEIVVSAFPGDVGGLLPNINRWRSQIGLGPVGPENVAVLTSNLDVNGTQATLVDFKTEAPPSGKAHPQRMMVVTIPHAGDSWFFKLTGDAPFVETQKETFLQFVRSAKF